MEKNKRKSCFPTSLKFQRIMPGSEHMVTATWPQCSLMVHLSRMGQFYWECMKSYSERGNAAIFPGPHSWCQTSFVCALLSSAKEPVKFLEQCDDPEKTVLPLREWVSWCVGLWVRSVLISQLSPLLGRFDIFVEGKDVLPKTVFSHKKTSSATKHPLRIHNRQKSWRSCE